MGKICQIISTPWPPQEGISNYVRGLSRELTRRGNEVTVITRGSPWIRLSSESNGMTVLRPRFLPVYPFHVQVHARLMEKALKSLGERFDLIHCHSPLTLPPKGHGPVVSTFHSPMAVGSRHIQLVDLLSLATKTMRPFSVAVEEELIRCSGMVSSVSAQTRSELAPYGLREEDVHVLWNAVDPSLFKPAHGPAHSKEILYAGRLFYEKGLFDLIKCAKIVVQNHPDWHFSVVGEGPLKHRIVKLARDMGLGRNQFIVKGFVHHDKLAELYRNAQLFVLPSHHEGLPTALLEAMASGLPVVATSVGGVRDLIEGGQNGLLCMPGDPASLAETLMRAIRDRQLCRSLARRARALVVKRFTWRRVAERFSQAVQEHLPGIVT